MKEATRINTRYDMSEEKKQLIVQCKRAGKDGMADGWEDIELPSKELLDTLECHTRGREWRAYGRVEKAIC